MQALRLKGEKQVQEQTEGLQNDEVTDLSLTSCHIDLGDLAKFEKLSRVLLIAMAPQLSSLSALPFQQLKFTLQVLDLSDNSITELPEEFIFPSLRRLALANNKIESMDKILPALIKNHEAFKEEMEKDDANCKLTAFIGLVSLDLSDNPVKQATTGTSTGDFGTGPQAFYRQTVFSALPTLLALDEKNRFGMEIDIISDEEGEEEEEDEEDSLEDEDEEEADDEPATKKHRPENP